MKIELPQANKKSAVTNQSSQKDNDEKRHAGFVDGRAEAAVQRKFQKMADNSSYGARLSSFAKMCSGSSPIRQFQGMPDHNPLKPFGGKDLPIQRMVLLPFKAADKDLTKFVDERSGGLAEGTTVKGTPDKKIGVKENLAVVGHGNGFEIYSHDGENVEGFKKYNYVEFGDFLIANVLPAKYTGHITVWSCESATPWKNIPDIAKQLPKGSKELDNSFIKLLKAHLFKNGEELTPTVSGAIGFASLDKQWNEGEVYLSKELKNWGPKKKIREGFIEAEQAPPGKEWYGALDEDSSDSSDSYREENDDVPTPKPQEQVPVVMVALRDIYPNFALVTADPQTAGARKLKSLGDVRIPRNTPISQMAYVAMMSK